MESRDKLRANLGGCGNERRDETVSKGRSFIVRYRFRLCVVFGRCPALGDAILEVYDRWRLKSDNVL